MDGILGCFFSVVMGFGGALASLEPEQQIMAFSGAFSAVMGLSEARGALVMCFAKLRRGAAGLMAFSGASFRL